MKTFKSYVTEKSEGVGNLYHTTALQTLNEIIKDDAIRLTFSSAIESEEISNPNTPFFLSTSRKKFGNYASKDFKSEYFPAVTINIDIDKLKKYGIPFKDWDYWGDSFKKVPDYREEEEVRIFNKDDKLGPLNKFIDEIHVFVSKSEHFAAHTKHNVQNIINSHPKVPIYFYDNALAYKTQRSEFAIKDIGVFVNKLRSPSDEEAERWTDDVRNNKYRDEGDFLIKTMLKIYAGKFNKDKQDPSPSRYTTEARLFEYVMAYDGIATIMNDFHGAMRHHPPAFKQWDMAMKKAGVSNTRDFVEKIRETAQSLYDVYGNRKTNETV
tara:strand:+ start:509 stop:1480 length:972 start_codon:yes stop_codon:yes gene_type:complete